MKEKVLYFFIGIVFMSLIAATPSVKSIIFKPQRPKAVLVKMFYAATQSDVSDYIYDASKKGWIVKEISQSQYGSGYDLINYTVFFESY